MEIAAVVVNVHAPSLCFQMCMTYGTLDKHLYGGREVRVI